MHCGVTYATEKAVENNDFLLNNTHIYRQSNQNNLSIKKILVKILAKILVFSNLI